MTEPRGPSRRFSLGDVIAGVSVALLLVPQAVAYADLAGLPAHVGLYAAALPPIAAAAGAALRRVEEGSPVPSCLGAPPVDAD